MADTLEIFGTEYTGVTGIIATTPNETDLTYIRPQGTKSISANGTGIDVTEYVSVDVNVSAPSPSLQSKTKTYTPTETAQTESVTADSGYDGLDTISISVGAISSTYVGTGITRRSSTDLTASGANVSVPSGYYASNASKAVSSGSATPASSISATGATVSTGTNTLTLSKSVSNTPQVSAGYISSGTAGNSSVSLTASVNTRSSSDLTANNLTVTAPSGYYASNASKTLSDQNLVASNIKKDVSIFGVTGSYEGGGSSDVQVGMATATANSYHSIAFMNLLGEPTSYIVMAGADVSPSSTPMVASIVYDGTNIIGQTITNTSNAQVTYDSTSFTDDYNYNTLSISSGDIYFDENNAYALVYTYGGNATNIGTASVQVGSGATSITFTGLEDDPIYWSCIFKSNFGTSNGYQRVIAVMSDPNTVAGTYGLAMDSASHLAQNWSYSSNGSSLTITSVGTNQGGYFHQPGYYQLTYAIAGDPTLQTKTVTPTTSTQNVTADTAQGYTALKKVVVNPIPSSYVQPTTTVGATTYRASTSSQTIQSGTYHSAAATIAAVSQTNLSAENIKSGTTISISNGQNNLWSVTGTYSGGGGGANIATATMTNSSNQNTSISFTLPSGRTPKAFFARLTSQIARSSNSRYYYAFDMRWDGSSTGGVAGNTFYMSSGTLTNVTSGYSYSQSGTTFTLSSTGSRSASPGSFYNGTYELVYIY